MSPAILSTVLLTLAAAPGDAAPAMEPIFDGESLDGWRATSDANWRVEDGAIVVDSGAKGFLLHRDRYENYELSVEFKADRGTNSGIFLNTTESPEKVDRDCYELNIAPPDNPFPTGSLVGRKKFEGAGETDGWRRFHVRVAAGRVTVTLDGEPALDYRADEPAAGSMIGLQKNEGRVAFRNIRVLRLP